MAVILLVGLQMALTIGIVFWLWRRVETLRGEIASLRAQLETRGAVRVRARASGESVRLAPVDEAPIVPSEPSPARVLRLHAREAAQGPIASPETLRGAALAFAAAAPAALFLLNIDVGAIAATGVVVGGLMMLLALSRSWNPAAWASVLTVAAWTLIAFASGGAQAEPGWISATLAFAGSAGLIQAFLSRIAPGSALALIAAIGALALGSLTGLVGPAGLAFGTLVALGAMVGALNLRVEGIHMAAFGAALLGLFVLSGQDSAAIWFTPIAAWEGALFFAVAAIRTPDLGARGLALAGTGVLGPLAAIAALYWAGHGLADPRAAAIAFVVAALGFAGVIAAATMRKSRTLASLKLTLWVLAGGAFAAIAAAIALVAPTPIAASAFALFAVLLLVIDWRLPDNVWRTLAWIAAAFVVINGAIAANMLLTEAPGWSPYLLLLFGLALPAVLSGGAASLALRQPAPATASVFEAIAIIAAVLGANLTLRVLASGGALLLTPVSFAEAGLHISVWLIISLLLAVRWRQGAQSIRAFSSIGLGGAALIASIVATLLWLTPHWVARTPDVSAGPMLQFAGLGFLAPAIMFAAHWVLWRGRGSNLRTRLSLGASALLIASMVTLLSLQFHEPTSEDPDWLGAIVATIAFAIAIGLNFANGVTRLGGPPPSYFQENLQGQRRRQLRRQPR